MAGQRRAFSRDQRSTIVYGMLVFVLMIVILQLWLFTATMNAFLGGDAAAIWPAAGASLTCLALNVGLLRYLSRIERQPQALSAAATAPGASKDRQTPA